MTEMSQGMNRSSSSQTQPTANVSLRTLETTVTPPDNVLAMYLLPGVLLGVLAFYVLVEVWALKRDRKDRAMVGATVIPQMQYHRSPHNYMLQFYTGGGQHDGTTANVYCCLHGNKRQTKPVVLRDPKRLLFQRGTVSSFLVSFNRSLDQIKSIHIWHDIAGPDPPWFLERAVVCHLNTGLTWHFEANRWFDVSQGDGTVECVLEPETRKRLLGCKRLFDQQLGENFRNKHMWFSPFLLKERTKFNRAQRVTCCGGLIGMSMLAVTVIIHVTSNLDIFPKGVFRLGPMMIALEDIFKAAACAGFVFVFRLLLEFLMRTAKRKSDLSPDEKDVKGYLGYCKDTVGKMVFIDNLSKTDNIPKNKTGQSCSEAPKTEENETANEEIAVGFSESTPNCQHEKHEIADGLRELCKASQSQNVEQDRPQEQVHSTFNEDEFSALMKTPYPSVCLSGEQTNTSTATEPFGLLERVQDRKDSLTSSIDVQLFSERRRSSTSGLNEEAGESCVSSDPDPDDVRSDTTSELLTLEDVQILQDKHDEMEDNAGRSFSPMSDSSFQDDNSTDLGNGLGGPQTKKGEDDDANVEVQSKGGKPGLISSPCVQLKKENSTGRQSLICKASRKTVVKDPGKRKQPYIVEDKLENNLERATGSTQTRFVTNIDNAPRLWKAFPFPREHLDKYSLKKLNEDNVYNLSHLWLIVTIVLCAISPLTAAVATVHFGLSWSFEAVISWLVTVALTIIFQSFIVETIFLFFHALYSAIWLKRPPDERNLLHELMNKVWIDDDPGATYFVDDLNDTDRTLIPRPPTPEERRDAKERAGHDRELEQVLAMILFDVLFLVLLMIIGIGNRDPLSYPMRETMENTFNPSQRFMKIHNAEMFWLWAKRDLIAGVYDVHHKHFLSDKYNSLLGTPIIRQKRLRMGGTCPLPKEDIKNFFDECRARFVTEESEDKDRYYPTWRSDLTTGSNHSSSPPWSYQSESESHTEYSFTGRVGTHGGGGYIARLGFEKESAARLLNELQAHTWVDRYTRTVVFEVSTYNANVNILSVLSFCLEFTPSNGALPRIDIFSFRLYRYFTSFQLIFLICEGVFVAFIVQLIYRTVSIISLEGKAYFASVWNYSDLLLILFSLITIGLYGARANNLGRAIKNIQEDSSVFYGFYSIAMSDNLVAYMSCLVFIVPTIQFLKFLKFNKDFMVFYSTLSRIRSDLGGFTVVLFISLMIFSFWAFVMLRTKAENYATFMSVFGNMVSLIMGSFNFRIMTESRDLGPLFTYTFTFVNMFILMNIVLCIISIGFKESRSDERFQKSEYEVVAFIIYRIKRFLGLLPPYIPPPPKIVPPKVSYISEQWILNTRYITRNQVHRLDNFADNSYTEDFADDFQIFLRASGISHQGEFVLDLIQRLVVADRQSPEERHSPKELKNTTCNLDQEEDEIEQPPKIKIVLHRAEDEDITAGDVVRQGSGPMETSAVSTFISESGGSSVDTAAPQSRDFLNEREGESNTEERAGQVLPVKQTAATQPKRLMYSLRRQLFEESLRSTRRKSFPDIEPEAREFVSHGEGMTVLDQKNVNDQDKFKPDVSSSDATTNISHNKRASEASANQMSRPHPEDEALERYRFAIENEIVSGCRQVFVKSAFFTQPGQKERSLEKRRWSIGTELPVSMDSASCGNINDSSKSPLSTPEPSRRKCTQRRLLSLSRKRRTAADAINTRQIPTQPQEKTTRGRQTVNAGPHLSGQAEAAHAPNTRAQTVAHDTIYTVIRDLLPGAASDRNRRRRHNEIIEKPHEFLQLLTLPLQGGQDHRVVSSETDT